MANIFEKNNFYHIDALEGLMSIDSNSVDLIVTSPPYNVGKKYENYNDDLTFADYHIWLSKVLTEMYRVIKPNANIFINIPP